MNKKYHGDTQHYPSLSHSIFPPSLSPSPLLFPLLPYPSPFFSLHSPTLSKFHLSPTLLYIFCVSVHAWALIVLYNTANNRIKVPYQHLTPSKLCFHSIHYVPKQIGYLNDPFLIKIKNYASALYSECWVSAYDFSLRFSLKFIKYLVVVFV